MHQLPETHKLASPPAGYPKALKRPRWTTRLLKWLSKGQTKPGRHANSCHT